MKTGAGVRGAGRPRFLVRLLSLPVRCVYRLEVVGREHLPDSGGALLVPNHISFVDGLLLLVASGRRVRFLVDRGWYEKPWLRPFLKVLGAIPVSARSGPRELLRSLRRAGRWLEEGELVCVFPEGQISRTGELQPFRRGFRRVVQGRDVPVVPVHLGRLWGSLFSRSGGRFIWKLPRRLRYPVSVWFGEPLPPDTPVHRVRQAVVESGAQAWSRQAHERRPLHRSFLGEARRHPLARAFLEKGRPDLRCFRAAAVGVALARTLRSPWRGQARVGILLPPGMGGALANLAASLAGRISVNLNWTAGPRAMASAARQAGLRTVLTSRRFLDRADLETPPDLQVLEIEDLLGGIGTAERWTALLLVLLAPASLVERACGAPRPVRAGDPVTVIFSSGTTGEPKGVPLTHAQLDSNIEAAHQVLRPLPSDRALGILPFFHSFGFFLLWFALNHRVATVFHPNPLDAGAVGELVEAHGVTLLVCTPTFLRIYLRRCEPGQFGSLRLVITGAEKLPEDLARRFEDRFGVQPLEGYGATECSPVIAVNAPDFRSRGFYQQAARRGTVGRPLPGVAVRVVDAENGTEPLGPGEEGMVLVRGPNVMDGYLDRPDLTEGAFRDGWYETGDIGVLDEDGFLRITDRLARFAKIGGEMVPHGEVEQALQQAAGEEDPVFAVTSLPDPKKGERLAVLHTLEEARIPEVLDALEERDLPNLFLPRKDAFVRVEELPRLGTGKLDLKEVRRRAEEALGEPG